MKNKFGKAMLIAAGLSLLISGCGQEAGQTMGNELSGGSEPAGSEEAGSERMGMEGWKLRDSRTIYEQDDEDSVVTMYLTVREGNDAEGTNHTWEEVNSHSAYYYDELGIERYQTAAILQVGDENGPVPGEFGYGVSVPNATVQIRGQTSSRGAQKNYKISIKDGKGTFREQKTIALNKHMSDGLRFRNKLCYDLMKDIPQMMSARTQFVHLFVKDETEGGSGDFEDYGLYTQVEQINKTYLKNHGLDKNGQLYKINFFEFFQYGDAIRLKTDPEYDVKAFEEYLEIKGNDDHAKLIAMLSAVNDYSVSVESAVEQYFDAENLMYWMAFHILAGNTDTNARNYYLYSPLNSEKFYIISWDNDVAFKRKEYELGSYSEGGAWEVGISNYWGNVLYQRMFRLDKYRDMLDDAIRDLKANYFTEEKLAGMAQTYAQTVKPYVFRLPDIEFENLTPDRYDDVAASVADEVETNYRLYLDSLEKPTPFYIGVPQKAGGKITVGWDAAYDFDNEEIRYTFELARDYTFENPLYRQEGIRVPAVTTGDLPEGQYFIRVTAENESGFTQTAFDYYVTEDGKQYGVKCFYILEDGSVAEDVYEE